MCSNCSGDDLRPESFTSFDISSPKLPPVFASGGREKRSTYGTRGFLPNLINTALTLAIARRPKSDGTPKIIRSVHRGNSVNLFLSNNHPKNSLKTVPSALTGAPFDVRVSPNEIIEVYVVAGPDDVSRDDLNRFPPRELSAWDESCIARRELRQAMGRHRRGHRMRIWFSYGVFFVIAALVAWCAIR